MNAANSPIFFPQFQTINCRGKLVDLSQPVIMGILNLTPDSFSDGGKYNSEKSALKQAEKMIQEGAAIIDIGAQSTRPNAELLSSRDEIRRLGKIISSIKLEFPETLISLDSFYADTMKYGFDEGIDLINDISGGMFDENVLPVVAEMGLPYILMHVNPTYELMHIRLVEDDIILALNYYFSEKTALLKKLEINDIILDPGFGFGKNIPQQYQMIEELNMINFGTFPLLVGISRKSFIYKPFGKSPLDIQEETQKLHLKALQNGAKILRVHDVGETKNTIELFQGN